MSRNELFVIQEQIWSAFEQDVAANGILAVMAKRTLDNQIAEVEGKFAAFGDTLAGLWGAAVDAGDLVVTGVLGGDDAQSLYEFVSGSEVGSLTERNNLAKGAVEVATNTAEYVENVASGKKSWQDVAQDAGDAAVSIGTGLYNDYIDPFVKDEKYKQDNLHGGLWTRSVWTRSVDESYAKGQNEFKKDMVVAEAVLTVYSGGMGTAALKGGKSVAKLDVDAPHGKQPHADVDADGGKGRGGLLHGSGVDDMLEGVPLKDGKLKTKAKLLDDVLKELSETIAKFLEKMSEQLNGRLVVMEDAMTGQRFFFWEKGEGYSFSKDRTGQGGSHSSGTSKGHDGKVTDTDVPSKNTSPKGGKASGDLGHSHHDEPVIDKKGNDANKNQSHEKEKAGAEGTGNLVNEYLDDIVDASGNISHTKMNNLKNAIQNNKFTPEELSQISKKMSDLGIASEYYEVLLKIDFGKYLRGLKGDPPVDMVDPHAHHTLFKKGLGEAQRKLVQEGQDILRKHGIDPIIGGENLVWAPNRVSGQHGIEALENVVKQLKAVDAAGGEYDDFVEILEDLGKLAASRR